MIRFEKVLINILHISWQMKLVFCRFHLVSFMGLSYVRLQKLYMNQYLRHQLN